MKAVPFLEWFSEYFKDSWGKNKLDMLMLRKPLNFYSQPFSPELITELFEGIYLNDNSKMDKFSYKQYLFETQNGDIQIHRFVDAIQYETEKGKVILRDCPPKTLNDFISDCQRAGIELHFKPEIEKEFFK